MNIETTPTPQSGVPAQCSGVAWEMDTDESLGAPDQEYEEAEDPDDLDTSLSSDECFFDTVGATILTDGMTGCITGAEGGVSIGNSSPRIWITKRLRLKKLTSGQKRRLKKALHPR